MFRRHFVIFSVLLPLISQAAEPSRPLHFFDNIPGLQNSPPQSQSRRSEKESDILIEDWGTSSLDKDTDLDLLKFPKDAKARSEMIEKLVQYRIGVRASMEPEEAQQMQGLARDLQWAAEQGVALKNSQQLFNLEARLQGMTFEQQLQYVQKVPGPLGESLLDASLNFAGKPEAALKFIIQNPQAFSADRRDTLIYRNLRQIRFDQEDPSKWNLSLIRQATGLLDYRNPHTVCRAAVGFPANDQVTATTRGAQREYYELLTRGAVEMKKQNVDCRDYADPQVMIQKLELLEQQNIYGRGFFSSLIQRLKTSPDSSSTIAASLPAPQKLTQCQIDRAYQNDVRVELNQYKNLKKGASRLYGTNTKGQCSLQIIGKKITNGYQVRIVLFNSSGETLIRFDQAFNSIEDITNAALFGKAPATETPSPAAPLKTSKIKTPAQIQTGVR
jgi:hypothetical protein